MTTDRLLKVIGILRHSESPQGLGEWSQGWNAFADALANQVRLEEALYQPLELASTDRAAGLAAEADRSYESWTPAEVSYERG